MDDGSKLDRGLKVFRNIVKASLPELMRVSDALYQADTGKQCLEVLAQRVERFQAIDGCSSLADFDYQQLLQKVENSQNLSEDESVEVFDQLKRVCEILTDFHLQVLPQLTKLNSESMIQRRLGIMKKYTKERSVATNSVKTEKNGSQGQAESQKSVGASSQVALILDISDEGNIQVKLENKAIEQIRSGDNKNISSTGQQISGGLSFGKGNSQAVNSRQTESQSQSEGPQIVNSQSTSQQNENQTDKRQQSGEIKEANEGQQHVPHISKPAALNPNAPSFESPKFCQNISQEQASTSWDVNQRENEYNDVQQSLGGKNDVNWMSNEEQSDPQTQGFQNWGTERDQGGYEGSYQGWGDNQGGGNQGWDVNEGDANEGWNDTAQGWGDNQGGYQQNSPAQEDSARQQEFGTKEGPSQQSWSQDGNFNSTQNNQDWNGQNVGQQSDGNLQQQELEQGWDQGNRQQKQSSQSWGWEQSGSQDQKSGWGEGDQNSQQKQSNQDEEDPWGSSAGWG
eukprot:TRINITY_DN2640_c0_g1_i12.p1 TRINITY_DN2640_c0_g1~~TRINITY_DN2640_c0_g1_i12.p1  ORF type:complete len:511 (+),score=87.68 TRINITY_DN2640_c0_g1_i12:172-1704(+)